jgi:hypothetical protein
MSTLPYPRANKALSSGDQYVVRLRELGFAQSIERIVEMNLK